MHRLTKTVLGAATAATLVSGLAAPAAARPYYRGGYGHYYGGRHDGLGNFLAGALVVGGIAAVASAASRDRAPVYGGGYDRPYDRGAGYDRGASYDNSAIDDCARVAEREGDGYGDGRATVRDIHAVDGIGRDTRYAGTLEVARYDGGRDRYNRIVRFTCTAEDGRVRGFRFED